MNEAAAFQLAQLNIARSKYGMDAPEMQGFNNRPDKVNASVDDRATQYHILGDPMHHLVNLSVWASFEAFSFARPFPPPAYFVGARLSANIKGAVKAPLMVPER